MLIKTKLTGPEAKALSRRHFLHGAGFTIALPLFASLVPRRVDAAAAAPCRFIIWWFPDGSIEDKFNGNDKQGGLDPDSTAAAKWFPTGSETNFTMAKLSKPLEEVKSDLVMLQGINHRQWGNGANCPHVAGPRFSLTSDGPDSIDQAIGKRMKTRFRTLELGIGSWIDGQEASNAGRIHRKDGQWIAPQIDPNKVFADLFAGGAGGSPGNAEDLARLQKKRKSVLDSAVEEINSLSGKLSKGDKDHLAFYATSIRDAETSLVALNEGVKEELADTCKTPGFANDLPGIVGAEKTGGSAPQFPKIAELQMKLTKLAFQCDLTRVVTLFFEKGRSGQVYSQFLDLPKKNLGTHDYAHTWWREKARETSWEMVHLWRAELLRQFVKDLKATPDFDGKTLYDNLILVKTSEISTGVHGWKDIPMLVAGRGAGKIRTGRYLRSGGAKSSQVWMSVVKAMGVSEIKSFPEASSPHSSSEGLAGLVD
ncbi:MAG: DUF1552 domain-containing protein [Myxococcales bacterium]|nr:DUF1552 domain-containing protein [Myxococcales bacterium]